ncbi:hypothetical protein Q9Q94_08755 [Uliginosibacterium sp. 31-16]|uniref:hypothetical protein n=1 Tax=Uliginosibacterium sp. 31-16 TaxID=3068315 RepID=UPI00273D543E|nr:hypothetical protein [Uliginosibacterium sp. 31-16]MDP5239617.1 hypothetical protein [Uliginosibacterium sp. 31-16]
MKLPDVGQLRLDLEIAFWRHGWRLPVALLALGLCLVVWLFWVPMQVASASRASEQLKRAQLEARRPVGNTAQEPPLQAFQHQLLPQAETTLQLRQIFQLAANARLTVAQVDMRRQIDAAGAYSQLQIVLPVRGDYLSIKRFCSDLLQGLQALSIDQIVLKREQPGQGPVDAQISLSVWQEPGEGSAR